MLPLALLALPALQAPPSPAPDLFAALAFLEGRWVAEGKEGEGSFSFERSLGGHVLLRKNRARVPGAGGALATHEDLMVVSAAGALRADYFDNEGHVIRYTTVETAPDRVAFLSAGPGPRFRLVYQRTGADTVEIRFEIAPPDQPDQVRPYLTGKARRAK